MNGCSQRNACDDAESFSNALNINNVSVLDQAEREICEKCSVHKKYLPSQ